MAVRGFVRGMRYNKLASKVRGVGFAECLPLNQMNVRRISFSRVGRQTLPKAGSARMMSIVVSSGETVKVEPPVRVMAEGNRTSLRTTGTRTHTTSVVQTAGIGNRDDKLTQFNIASATATVQFLAVHWDGDKVRGLRVEMSDGTKHEVGDFKPNAKTKTTEFRFEAGETLKQAWLRDSGYGHCSVRQIEFTTSSNRSFIAGPSEFDKEVPLDVEGALLVGFHVWRNPDNFINGLCFNVRCETPSQPSTLSIGGPAATAIEPFETRAIGNPKAAATEVTKFSKDSTARYIAARWDNDKVRGIRMILRDGTVIDAGAIQDGGGSFASYTFEKNETLVSLSMSSSGYGHGSLRRFEFTTSANREFKAGPTGIDDIVTPPVVGACFVGFHAWVNKDQFINALAFRITNDAAMHLVVRNFSPWPCVYSNGELTINNSGRIRIAEHCDDDHKSRNRVHNRVVQVSSGQERDHCEFDGSATHTVSVFGDGTFSAKFDPDCGHGAVHRPIAGLSRPTDRLVLLEALVRKYAPIYMLNADEVYWQSNVDAFLQNMIMQRITPQGLQDFFTDQLDRDKLANLADKLGADNNNEKAFLRTKDDLNHANDTQDWFLSRRPLVASELNTYAVVVEGSGGFLDIVYWWFFNYNQGKNVASTNWGNHLADWVHVKVHLGNVHFDRPQEEPHILKVTYDAHGDKTVVDNDQQSPPEKRPVLHGKQVLVHLAAGSHEAYPRPGKYQLHVGTEDVCRDNAYRFDSGGGQIEIYIWKDGNFQKQAGAPASFRNPNWLEYKGRWGNRKRGDLANLNLIAKLESGPEGLFRPQEYEPPHA